MVIIIVRALCKLDVANLVDFDAVTENCRRVRGVWFCFGGGSCVLHLLCSDISSCLGTALFADRILVTVKWDSTAVSECMTSATMVKSSEHGNVQNASKFATR